MGAIPDLGLKNCYYIPLAQWATISQWIGCSAIAFSQKTHETNLAQAGKDWQPTLVQDEPPPSAGAHPWLNFNLVGGDGAIASLSIPDSRR